MPLCATLISKQLHISLKKLGRLMRTSPGCRAENCGLNSVLSNDLTLLKRVQKNPIPLFHFQH